MRLVAVAFLATYIFLLLSWPQGEKRKLSLFFVCGERIIARKRKKSRTEEENREKSHKPRIFILLKNASKTGSHRVFKNFLEDRLVLLLRTSDLYHLLNSIQALKTLSFCSHGPFSCVYLMNGSFLKHAVFSFPLFKRNESEQIKQAHHLHVFAISPRRKRKELSPCKNVVSKRNESF